ncbi:MAG: hypothetical protein EON57_07545 [Alphaproteobacteria bacterium]|nr:MAG: hypothetical protein EON57_07545 [Alphaproteobacteria bacterium]
MRRLPTTLALGAWIGFLAVEVLQRVSGLGDSLRQSSPVVEATAVLSRIDLPTFLLLLAGVLLASGLHFLIEERIDRRPTGERLGMVGLGVLALLASAPGLGATAPLGASLGFWAALAGTVAFLTFDHFITDESPDDEAEFRAGIAVIAAAMAQQTRLYAEPAGEHEDRRR